MTAPPTPAQEAITNAMLAILISCCALSLALVEYLQLTTPLSYVILAIISLVASAYIVPNITALWLGRPLHDIMTEGQKTS